LLGSLNFAGRNGYACRAVQSTSFGAKLVPDISVTDQLQKELNRAQEEHLAALGRFNALMRSLPTGDPNPDASTRVQQLAQEARAALRRYMHALDRSIDFLVRGIVPDDLKRTEERKPATSQQSVPEDRKRSG
jgi:hypothetical protein